MGKIYQALQHARNDRNKLQVLAGEQEASPAPVAPVPREAALAAKRDDPPTLSMFKSVLAPASPEAEPVPEETFLPLTLELEAEKEMATLYQNIEALVGQARNKIIQFIGSHPGEGTSTIARDFARFSATRLGKKVLFLEGDPANPSQSFSGGSRMVSLEETVRRGEEVEKVFAQSKETGLAVGLVAREEGSLIHFLESEDRAPIWERLKMHYDLVVIDSPPLSTSAAGLAFCRRADGVVLVLEAERTRGPVAERAKEQIQKNGGNILGVVFNKRKFYIPKSIYKRL
jgi:protein-tyrosine kinase